MNRPFVLGLSGAAIVGAAIGLSYIVDSKSGEETAADLKTPERSTGERVPDKTQSSVWPRQNAVASKTPERSSDGRVPDKTQSSVWPRQNAVASKTPERSSDGRVPDKTQSSVSPRQNAVASKTPERSSAGRVPDRARSSISPRQSTVASKAPERSIDRIVPVKPQSAVTLRPNRNRETNAQTGNSGTAGLIAPRKPTFDVVRVNPRGDAVIAGRASPNAAVIIRDGEREVGRAKADARGEWVVIPSKPLPKGSRELTLSAKSRDGTATQSDRNVVIVIPGRPPQTATESRMERAPGALAVLVPREGKAGSIVMQKPSEGRQASSATIAKKGQVRNFAEGGEIPPVSIDAVDYDEAGNVTISGNAATKAPLTVYIDNQHAASGVSDRQGRWRVVPSGALTPGIHTLRIDHLGPDGKVIGRAETRFARANPPNPVPDNAVVHVQPGNSLWRIARRVYGAGIQYSVIFDANREQIRDPDLIYPGQVFFVPHAN